MKNYIQPGHTITLAAPSAVTSGSGVLVGAIFGIAAHDAASGEPVEALTVGVIDINKVGSQAWAVGDKVYWDNTNKRTTKTATDNTLIGVALGAVGSGADETTGRVRLNGCF
jgi:predicted RecA/RadA family phage recombinase